MVGAWLKQRIGPIAAVLLAITQLALLCDAAIAKSDTVDEEVYIGAGAVQWRSRDLVTNYHAPALPKWAFGASLAIAGAIPDNLPSKTPEAAQAIWPHRTEASGKIFTLNGNRRVLLAARAPTVLVTVLAGLFLFGATRRSFGILAGVLVHAMWCFSPTILANGCLATLDAWTADTVALAIYMTVRWRERANTRAGIAFALATGATLGLALATKITTIVAAPVCIFAGVQAMTSSGDTFWARWKPRVRLAAVALAGLVIGLWAVYLFHVGRVGRVPALPFPEWFQGFYSQFRHGYVKGHRTLALGTVTWKGNRFFYFVCLAFKVTPAAQLLALGCAGVMIWKRAAISWRKEALLLAAPIFLFGALSFGKTQLGIRYLLPIFPFFLFWLGHGIEVLANSWKHGGRAAAALVAIGAIGVVSDRPNYLMYFNLWCGGPDHGADVLIDGSDWGQDQLTLYRVLRDRQIEEYTYVPMGNPERWGLVAKLPPCKAAPGVHVISAFKLRVPPPELPRGCLDWMKQRKPTATIGHSIYLYGVKAGEP